MMTRAAHRHRKHSAWMQTLKGLGMALLVTVAGVAIFALLMQWIRPSESAVRVINQVLKLASGGPESILPSDAAAKAD